MQSRAVPKVGKSSSPSHHGRRVNTQLRYCFGLIKEIQRKSIDLSSEVRFRQGNTKESDHSKSNLPDQFPDSKMPTQNNWVLILSCHIPTPQRLAFKQINTRISAAQHLLNDYPYCRLITQLYPCPWFEKRYTAHPPSPLRPTEAK